MSPANRRWYNRSGIGGFVIHRRPGERISINDGEILIELVEVAGKEARIAIKAPEHVVIERDEKRNSYGESPKNPSDAGV